MTQRCKDRMREAGINVDAELKAYYPRLVYYDCVRIAAEELFAGQPIERALHDLGYTFMSGFADTLMGKAIISAVRMLGPRRMLKKMTQNFRTSNNYMQTTFEERGPGDVVLTLSQVTGAPSYFEGVMTYAMQTAGASDFTIERESYDGTKCTFRIRWKGRT